VIVKLPGSLLASSMVSVQLSSQWNDANFFLPWSRMHVCQYSIGEMKHAFSPEPTSKRELARQVAAMYPVLTHDLNRESQNRHAYYLKMFKAMALGVVCYWHLEE
jgi:hypothetical protein